MPAWTLEEARTHLQAWLEAELAVSSGQKYRIGSRELARANLTEIHERVVFWRNEVTRLENGRGPGARVLLKILNSGYGNHGASRTKKSLLGWSWRGGSSDEDITKI